MNNEGPYVFVKNKVIFSNENHTIDICKDADKLAVLYDKENGVVLKFGESSIISEYYKTVLETVTSSLISAGMKQTEVGIDFMNDLEYVEFDISPETVEILNNCFHISGYGHKIKERLAEIENNISQSAFKP